MNPVQQKGIGNKRYPVGLCYVTIPYDIDRDKYVADCKRRGRITIITENGDIVFDCPVGISILDQIEFPDEIDKLGSQLIYITEHKHNKPIIIDRVLKDDESSMLNENEFRFERNTDNASVSIIGSAKDGNLFLNVTGKTEDGGKVYIDVGNDENSGGIIVNLKGGLQFEAQEIFINAIKDIVVKSVEGAINFGDTDLEPILKGSTTKDEIEKTNNLLQALINVITGSPINEPGSGSPSALQAALSLSISGQSLGNFSKIESEKTFTQ